MRRILIEILTVSIALFFLFSCAKTTHSVYLKVSGNSTSTKITYGEAASIDDARNKDSTAITVSSLPWQSDTYTVKDTKVFALSACNESGVAATVTIEIYDNGNVAKTSTCSTLNCVCQEVDYVPE
jgi:hypothetical protein